MPQIEHPEDTILVCNIDVNCSDPYSEEDIPNSYDGEKTHADFFQVKYGGQPFRIKPGETRRMPRYLAKHYAKHLADHILRTREIKEGKTGLLSHATERPKVLAQILVGVDQFYLPEMTQSEAEIAFKKFEEMNQDGKADNLPEVNMGKVVDPMVGVLNTPMDTEAIMKAAAAEDEEKAKTEGTETDPELPAEITSIFDPEKPLPSKAQLLKTAISMQIEVTGKETPEQLVEMLKKF